MAKVVNGELMRLEAAVIRAYEKRIIMQMTKDLGGGFYHE